MNEPPPPPALKTVVNCQSNTSIVLINYKNEFYFALPNILNNIGV